MRARKKTRSDDEIVLEFTTQNAHLEGVGEDKTPLHPLRTCIARRERKDKSDLLRFVLSPQGVVVADIKAKLPGRGVWVTGERASVELAIKKRAFARAFKREVLVQEGLAEQIDQLLKGAALDYLSIANKAGLTLTGFTKVEEALKRGDLIILLHALTAAEDGRKKLDNKFNASFAGKPAIPPKNCFTSEEISLATGSINVIHAGLKEGGASRAFVNAVDRWSYYRAGEVEQTRTLCQGRE